MRTRVSLPDDDSNEKLKKFFIEIRKKWAICAINFAFFFSSFAFHLFFFWFALAFSLEGTMVEVNLTIELSLDLNFNGMVNVRGSGARVEWTSIRREFIDTPDHGLLVFDSDCSLRWVIQTESLADIVLLRNSSRRWNFWTAFCISFQCRLTNIWCTKGHRWNKKLPPT